MHGMASAAIMILVFAVIAAIACYVVIEVIRGGPHDG